MVLAHVDKFTLLYVPVASMMCIQGCSKTYGTLSFCFTYPAKTSYKHTWAIVLTDQEAWTESAQLIAISTPGPAN